jgi:hypothetical protein
LTGDTFGDFWVPAYRYIYQTNAIIEGIQASTGIAASAKAKFDGEAKFLRALFYFYLVNLYGDVPFLTTTDYHNNAVATKLNKPNIYSLIVTDLISSENTLPSDYQLSGTERTRANKWAATALLARIYLYEGDWANAEDQASLLLDNNPLFTLDADLNMVFLNIASGNQEAILQWDLNSNAGHYNATPEGRFIIPDNPPNNIAHFYISPQLLASFELGDKRKIAWLDSTIYGTPVSTYYFPSKYKIGQVNATPGILPSELTTVLRLGEQYLIRAEARAQQNQNLLGAISDLNTIRERAGLADLSLSLNQQQVLDAVAQERRIELFAEWGHRWFDLKRTGKIDDVMNLATPLKGQGTTWKSYQQLYPIALSELQNDPYLTQNTGY